MKRASAAAALLAVAGAAAAAPPPPAAPWSAGPADLLMLHGKVYTPSGWAEAVAIRDGVIVAVGADAEVAARRGPATREIDLAGSAVFPGLHDMHVHVLFAGLEQTQCRLPPGARPDAIAAAVRDCARTAKPGEWILGGNWSGGVFAPGQQTAAFLDAVAPKNPVVLNDEAHHSLWLNTAALRAGGIDASTPDPRGGVIERDAAGTPNGLLREDATQLMRRVIPEPNDAAKRRALVLATGQMLSYGITSFTDASVRAGNLPALSSLARDGLLPQHARGCLVFGPTSPDGERLIRERAHFAHPNFRPDCVKIFLDGVPTEARTAAMLAPYVGESSETGNRGMLMMPQADLNLAVARFDAQGLSVKFHAAGDAAVRAALDAVEFARRKNGWGGPVHQVGHDTFVNAADIPRARDLHVAWEFSPYIWYPTPIADVDVRHAVGDERMERFVPIKDALATGALVVAGSDWSVVPSVNPWLAIETLVTREPPGGGPTALAAGQKIPLADAIRVFTANGAALMGRRHEVGSIEPGMRADLVVTTKNPFEIPIREVHTIAARYTVIDGRIVYDATRPAAPRSAVSAR